jgi:DNA-binding HxlR family transcriptional regulator/peroxiredoxin
VKYSELAEADCAIAQALGVVGDWWTLLVVRDVAGGLHRFDALQRELGVSRKVLTERLKLLVEHGVLEKRPYSVRPPRYEYHLSPAGQGLLPVLIALQDWGTRYVMGDGELTATSTPASTEARRVHQLVGQTIPEVTLTSSDNAPADPVSSSRWTVVYCFAGAYAPGTQGYPPGWGDIPGAPGCTVEALTFRDRAADFDARGATIHGVSTQRADQLDAFARHADLPFALLSDADLALAAALRLPTFRAAGIDRLKRLTLVVDDARTIRAVLFPVADPAGSVVEALTMLDALAQRDDVRAGAG